MEIQKVCKQVPVYPTYLLFSYSRLLSDRAGYYPLEIIFRHFTERQYGKQCIAKTKTTHRVVPIWKFQE